jgi:hypothetical protein
MIFIAAFLSFVFSFGVLYITRIYLTGNKLSTGDTFFHLLISESIREHQWKYPSSLYNVILSEGDKTYNYLAYPPLFHYIIALFPIRFHPKVARILNLVILSLEISLAASLVYGITSNLAISIFSSFFVAFNLSVFELVVHFTPRPLGMLFYSFVVYIAILCPQNLLSILVLTVLVMLISLTHKFATQAVIFGLLPYAFIFNRPYFLLSFVFGFLLSILVSRGFYIKILKEHINWLYFYSLHPRKAHIIGKLRAIFSKNFWYLVFLASMILLFMFNNEEFLYTDLIAKLTFWAFVNIVIALLVSIRALSFLGEEYRYVEYSVFPVGIASSLLIASSNIYVWFVAFTCALLSFLALFKFKRYLHHSKALVDPDDILAYRSLRDNLGNLLVLPHTRTLEVNYFTKLQVVHPVRKKFRSTSQHLDDLLKTYGIQYVLKFKDTDPFQIFATLMTIANLNKILVFKNFEVYKLSNKKGIILN